MTKAAMINKPTLAVLASAAAVSFASQAFGQAAASYGDVRPYHYGSDGSRKSGSRTAEQQGSTNAGQAQASGRQDQAGTQRAERRRGYSAFGQAPARRSSSVRANR